MFSPLDFQNDCSHRQDIYVTDQNLQPTVSSNESEIVEIVIQFQEILMFSALVTRLQDVGRSLCIKVHTKFCLLLFVCTELASTYHI